MADAKKKFVKYTTQVGTFKFLHAVTPDTKFGPPTFSVTVSFPEEVGQKIVADFEKLMPKFKGNIPYKVNDVGEYEFKVKQKKYIEWFVAGVKQSKEAIPVLLNSDNTPYVGSDPWAGSTGEVAIVLDESRMPNGDPLLALRLKGIRFHEVVAGGAGGGDPLFGSGVSSGDDSGEDDEDDEVPFN